MFAQRHSAIACTVVLLFGFVVHYVGTDGFRAFTAETARVNQLMEERPQFPEVTLEELNGGSI